MVTADSVSSHETPPHPHYAWLNSLRHRNLRRVYSSPIAQDARDRNRRAGLQRATGAACGFEDQSK